MTKSHCGMRCVRIGTLLKVERKGSGLPQKNVSLKANSESCTNRKRLLQKSQPFRTLTTISSFVMRTKKKGMRDTRVARSAYHECQLASINSKLTQFRKYVVLTTSRTFSKLRDKELRATLRTFVQSNSEGSSLLCKR